MHTLVASPGTMSMKIIHIYKNELLGYQDEEAGIWKYFLAKRPFYVLPRFALFSQDYFQIQLPNRLS